MLHSLSSTLFLVAFDGGHIVVGIFDSLRRKIHHARGRPDPGPVDASRLLPLTLVVIVILGGMSLLLMYADIVNPIRLFS